MSETYENFARDTYATVDQQVASALTQANGMPVIILSASEHGDGGLENILNVLMHASAEEPAMASAYTHIAAIESAVRAVGAENVIVSFEFDQEKLDARQGLLKPAIENEELSPEQQMSYVELQDHPVYVALYHATESGIETVASDPLHNIDNYKAQRRFDAEIETLEQHALRTENPPQIVVHIGGSSHIPMWQGHKIHEITDGNVNKDKDMSADKEVGGEVNKDKISEEPLPFEGVYGKVVFLNSYQEPAFEPLTHNTMIYARDPDNAIQIDPPGKMDKTDMDYETIIQRVQAAAADQAVTMPDPETTPDITTDPATTPRTP